MRELRDASGTILCVAVLGLIVALNAHGLTELRVAGVGIPPWAFAAVLAIGLVIAAHMAGIVTIGQRHGLSLIVIGSFFCITVWMVLSALRSTHPELGMPVAGVQIINLAVILSVGSLQLGRGDWARLNRAIFVTGALLAALSILLFIPASLRFPNLPGREGLGWVHDRGVALRLRGFASDPNFYSLYMAIPLFIGIAEKKLPFRYLGLGMILAALFLAQSRTFAVVFTLSLFLGPLATARRGSREGLRYGVRVGAIVMVVVAATATALSFSGPIRESLIGRVETISSQNRIPKWLEAWKQLDDPVLGSGLMTLKHDLGRFSHSTFLDVFVEMGIIGLVIWMGFLAAVTAGWWLMCRRDEALPWFQGWITLVMMSQAFSLLYNPVFALSAAVLVAVMGSLRALDSGRSGPRVGAGAASGHPRRRPAETSDSRS